MVAAGHRGQGVLGGFERREFVPLVFVLQDRYPLAGVRDRIGREEINPEGHVSRPAPST